MAKKKLPKDSQAVAPIEEDPKQVAAYEAGVQRIAVALTNVRQNMLVLVRELDLFEQTGIWKLRHQTFARFLHERFRLGAEWYANLKDAIAKIGHERVLKLGVDVAKVVAKLPNPEQRDRAIEAILSQTPDGAEPRASAARHIVKDIAPELRRPHTALTEVDRLRERIRALEAENDQLRAEIRTLRAHAAPAASRAAKKAA